MSRLERERRTLTLMTLLYCRARHTPPVPCPECASLLSYALTRIDQCPYAEGKPTCANCPIHCYASLSRRQIREVMRYAGPRMLFRHPFLAILHLLDGLKIPAKPGIP